jgi:transposase InsO family protein
MPLPPPPQPWEGVSMDFVTDLTESTTSRYTGILVIVDRLTKMAIYLPCRKDIDSPELARMFFEHVICKHGRPDNIVTDCGKEFTSQFWKRVCSHLSINQRLSTAFHPQTDGQTERQNQTMKQYLRAFCNYEQDNWVELLPLVEFA